LSYKLRKRDEDAVMLTEDRIPSLGGPHGPSVRSNIYVAPPALRRKIFRRRMAHECVGNALQSACQCSLCGSWYNCHEISRQESSRRRRCLLFSYSSDDHHTHWRTGSLASKSPYEPNVFIAFHRRYHLSITTTEANLTLRKPQQPCGRRIRTSAPDCRTRCFI